MKIIDEREMQKKKTKLEKNKEDRSYMKGWELNDFVVHLSKAFSN